MTGLTQAGQGEGAQQDNSTWKHTAGAGVRPPNALESGPSTQASHADTLELEPALILQRG